MKGDNENDDEDIQLEKRKKELLESNKICFQTVFFRVLPEG